MRWIRFGGLFVAWALAAQSAAVGALDVRVCRFTGRVIEDCPCPERSDRDARVEAAGCCEIRKAPAKPASAEHVSAAGIQSATAACVSAPGLPKAGTAVPMLPIPVETSPPGRSRLYVTLRHLLI